MSDNVATVEAEFTLLRKQLEGIRRRTAVRYRCALATLGQLTFPAGGPALQVWVANLSEAGVGLLLDRPLEPDTPLVLKLKGPEKGTVSVGARVVHSTPQEDGAWRVGCVFDQRLKPEALDDLL